jgi:magnesium-transporting ATPase (P-type)
MIVEIIIFLTAYVLGHESISNLYFAIGILVSTIISSMPTLLTASLAISAINLSKKNVLVKNVKSITNLAASKVIFEY